MTSNRGSPSRPRDRSLAFSSQHIGTAAFTEATSGCAASTTKRVYPPFLRPRRKNKQMSGCLSLGYSPESRKKVLVHGERRGITGQNINSVKEHIISATSVFITSHSILEPRPSSVINPTMPSGGSEMQGQVLRRSIACAYNDNIVAGNEPFFEVHHLWDPAAENRELRQ